MSKQEKLLKKLFNNSVGVTYKEIEYLLLWIGFKKIFTKGSHMKFKHDKLKSDLIIPVHNGACKPFYKSLTAKMIKKYFNYSDEK